jgi:ABC-type nitrate/sulfonate/bicarbonate transport system substrate-binding protein
MYKKNSSNEESRRLTPFALRDEATISINMRRTFEKVRVACGLALAFCFAAGALFGLGETVRAESRPQLIRIGHATAVEENLLAMDTAVGVTPGRGKSYEFTLFPFRSSSDRFKAYQADELDCATGAAVGLIFAAANGVDLKAVASISKTSDEVPTSEYWVTENSPIKSLSDLKGKTIAINGYRSTAELETRLALSQAGLDPRRDARFVVMGFPEMGDAVRGGQIDLATMVLPFIEVERKKGGLRKLFSSQDVLPFNPDLATLYCRPSFLEQHPATIRAFLADFVATTQRYLSDVKAARIALLDAKKSRIEPDVYLNMPDYYREPHGWLSIEDWDRLQDAMIKVGFMAHKIDIGSIVDQHFLSSPPPR